MKRMLVLILVLATVMVFGGTKEDAWQENFDKLSDYYYDMDYENGIELGKTVVKDAKKIFGEKNLKTALALNLLGLCYTENIQDTEAIEVLTQSYNIIVKLGKDEYSNAGIIAGNLGRAHYYNYDYELAEKYLKESIDFLEKGDYMGMNNEDIIISYYDLSLVYSEQGMNEEAADVMEELIDMEIEEYGKMDEYVANDSKDLAWIYVDMGEFDKAKKYMDIALEVRKEIPGADDMDLGIVYNDMGVLYDYMGKYDDAVKTYEKATDIFKKAGDDTELSNTTNNIGLVLYRAGEYKKAKGYFEKAYQMYKELYGEDDEYTIEAKDNVDLMDEMMKK